MHRHKTKIYLGNVQGLGSPQDHWRNRRSHAWKQPPGTKKENENWKNKSTEPTIWQSNPRKTIRIQRATLSVSGSLMRRTSREFRRTILLYCRVSVLGFTISTTASPIFGKNVKDYSLLLLIRMQFSQRGEVRSLHSEDF